MLKIHSFLKHDRKIIITALIAGLIVACAYWLYGSAVYARDIQRGIANSVVRLHVLANSDSESDQALKLHVRDGILNVMREFLTGDEDKAAATALIYENLDAIIAEATEIIRRHGKNCTVTAHFSRERFPTRHYNGISLPTGVYDALRVEIGSAQGQNWWCVAFPPLCFVNATRPTPTEPALNNVLTAEQYELVTITPESGLRLQARFRAVELWQEIFQ